MTSNTYSRFNDKELCDEYIAQFKNNFYSAEEYKECIQKKEYSQKLKHFLSGKDYSLSEDVSEFSFYIRVDEIV